MIILLKLLVIFPYSLAHKSTIIFFVQKFNYLTNQSTKFFLKLSLVLKLYIYTNTRRKQYDLITDHISYMCIVFTPTNL